MLKQAIARRLAGSKYYPAFRSVYRRLKISDRQKIDNINFYQRVLRPGDLVFDVGANVGFKTEVFLACGATVVAVEPNPNCYPVIEFDHGANNRFQLVKKGVGAQEDVLMLNVEGTAPTSSFRDNWRFAGMGYAGGAEAERVRVPVTTLDRIIYEYGTPDYLKIDVEGFELEVFKGLSTPIPLISFEYGTLEGGEKVLNQCLERLSFLGSYYVNAISDTIGDGFAFPDFLPFADIDAARLPKGGDFFVKFLPT